MKRPRPRTLRTTMDNAQERSLGKPSSQGIMNVSTFMYLYICVYVYVYTVYVFVDVALCLHDTQVEDMEWFM